MRGEQTTRAHTASKTSIVISHCDSPVGWIASDIDMTSTSNAKFEIADITILVSKYGEQVTPSSILLIGFMKIMIVLSKKTYWRVRVPAAGDEEEKGDSNKKKSNSNDDLIVFVKDNNYNSKKNYYIPFDVGVFATTALDAEFGCGVLKNGGRTNII